MENIIIKGRKYKYTSLLYTDSSEIGNISSDRIFDEQNYIFILKEEKNQFQIYWAAQTKEDFFYGLEKSLNIIKQYNTEKKRIFIKFIHEEFVEDLEKIGFKIESQFCDFWLSNINNINVCEPLFRSVRFMKEEEYREAADVINSCKGISRGFYGEDEDFVKEWAQDKNSCIIVAEQDNNIIGICLMNIYGFESEKGPIAWLREIAVHPDYQGNGIGYSLIYNGINWGKKQGAVRSFLAVDIKNYNAIKLYKKFGYKKDEGYGEIWMIRQ